MSIKLETIYKMTSVTSFYYFNYQLDLRIDQGA